MKKGTFPAIFAVILLLVAPVIASAMTNIPAEPKKGTPAPKQEATQEMNVQTGGAKAKEQDAIKKDSNKNGNPRSN